MSKDIYTCNICDNQFKSLMALNGHSRMHGKSNGKISHITCSCIFTKKEISVKNLTKYQKRLIECKNPTCNNKFSPITGTREYYCGRSCAVTCTNAMRVTPQEYMIEKIKYKEQCKFIFSFQTFPEEFDFIMIHQQGMYHSTKNKNGLTRDHMYSVHDGFVNKIDPNHISHPANCKIMPQPENSSKNRHSSLSLYDLYHRINEWDKKYKVIGSRSG